MANALDTRDGSFVSRKLWYAIGTTVLVFVAGVLAAFWPAFRSGLEVIVGGLIGTLAVYSGANVGTRYVAGKSTVTVGPQALGGYDPYGYDPYAPQGPYGLPGAYESTRPDPRPPVEPVPEEEH